MSPKYLNFILFYIFTTSCIIIAAGLNFEGVSSNDESKEDKSREEKGKKPSEDTQSTAKIAKKFDNTDVKKKRQNGSSSSSTSVLKEETFRQKTMQEPSYTTAEVALITALENACNDLKIGDLINAGSVCRSWNEIVERENLNRGLERALVPSIFSSEISNANSNFHVWDILNSIPNIAILFISPTLSNRPSICRNLEERTMTIYRKFFPHHLVTFGVDVSMMDENIIRTVPNFLHPHNGHLGLFIPLHKDVKIKVSSCSILRNELSILHHFQSCLTQITNDVILDSNKENSTIIILGDMSSHFTIKYLLESIKSSFMHKSYSLWGGVYVNTLIHSKTKDDISGEKTMVFAVSLSGSNIKSWSIFFDCQKEEQEINEKLLKFKKSLKLQQHTIGLVTGPEIESTFTKKHIMKLVKEIFPNIPFIGIFNIAPSYQIGVDSLSDDSDQQLIDSNSISLMIITYH